MSLAHTLLPRLAACAAAAAAASTTTIPACSLNGVQRGDGTCECDAGWGGAACQRLALSPAPPLDAAHQAYYHPGDNSWGLSVVREGQLWHGYMTEIAGNCSLSSYGTASRILHVVAPAPGGPWAVADVALSQFAHNPQIVRAADGSWLLFHIGAPSPPGCAEQACGGAHNASCALGAHGTSVAHAASPYGPWERIPYILPDNETNPSALILSDGSIAVTARRGTGGVPIYTAANWRGPYVAAPRAAVTLVRAGAPADDAFTPFDEDPFAWVDARGGVHMLTHRQPNGTACPQGPTPSDCDCAGGHMYAPALAGPWFVDLDLVYNCSLDVQGAAQPLRLAARQRPTLLLPARNGGEPACPLLFTGASIDPKSQYYSSFSMVQSLDCGAARGREGAARGG